MKLADILKDSNYKLSQFTETEIVQLEKAIALKTVKSGEVPYTICLVRQKEIKLTPEEVIRQLYLRVLIERLKYPVSRVQVEYTVTFGKEKKRADIAVMDKDRLDTPYIIVELKKPKLKDGKDQLKSYCNATGSPMGVWTNGEQVEHYQRKDPNFFEKIPAIPAANQTLADILQKKFTLDDLKALAQEGNQSTLKEIIDEMEDEVLANAGVDVFEEVFKLIFTKLFDEWSSGRKGQSGKRQLEFYNSGQTETELKEKIQVLFDAAKKKWRGVFKTDDKITLTGSHLMVCVSYLERYKLFNSNLDVVDEAFEYLINQSSKGEKGQYFTPRYVIDMCVKMLNPKEDESMIDTAAGSSGFPVHSMFHVWRQIYEDEGLEQSDMFTAEEKLPRCVDYVKEKVFAIDFDEKAVRVARTLNLIAGDGETNILHLNTLDYKRWKERIEDTEWQKIYSTGLWRFLEFQAGKKDDYKNFLFDIMMANPPFAGDIKESVIVSSYDLVRDKVGKGNKGVGRDILFIERNLDFLKPGGRMAVVLPQGRFNNSSDKYIRDFIADRCRILAVVGLHGNTFKPHTGTKTSVLFLQKWNDDPKLGSLCPRKDDYNIFFATMQKSGKDNSGEKIYVKRSDGSGDFLLDEHGHRIVDHDLFNHDGLTQDRIAEAFMEFAKKEGLSFFNLGSSVMPFDAEKYKRLMGELEAVELSIHKVIEYNLHFRFDSEFFKKKYFKIEAKIQKFQGSIRLSEINPTIIHPTEIKREYVENDQSGVLFFRTQNLRPLKVDLSNQVYISWEDAEKLAKNLIKKNDILITRTGANFGDTLIFNEDIKAIASSHVFILRNTIISQSFLAIFLNTFYGREQINKGMYGGVQPEVAPYYLKNITVPCFSDLFQYIIEKLVNQSYLEIDNSKLTYQQAEDLLLSELGLKDWQPTETTVAVKSFAESFLSSGRLDAEYYQPKYDQLLKVIQSSAIYIKKIGDIQKYNTRGLQPIYSENGKLNIINSRHILEQHLNYENFEKTDIVNWDNQQKARVFPNDILIYTTGANIGRTNVYLSEEKALASNHVNILRLHNENQVYVGFTINSIIGRLQTEKLSAGSAQAELYPKDIDNFIIPFIKQDKQQEIVEKYILSLNQKNKSKQLLEIAKTAVEKAIETDETNATDWINQQLQTLNIDIQKLE